MSSRRISRPRALSPRPLSAAAVVLAPWLVAGLVAGGATAAAAPLHPGGAAAPAPSSVSAQATPAPVPVTGDDDLGEWATGIPAPSAATEPAPPAPTTRSELSADLTTSIAGNLATRGRDARLGSAFSGQVVDLATGKALWSRSTTTARLPASNQKLVTAYVAMKSLGGPATLTTPVMQGRTYRSSIYVKGVGDPTLTSTRLNAMASTTASRLKAQGIGTVNVFVDDSLFPAPTNATGWKAEWVPEEVAPVRALVVDQVNVADTSLNAGYVFADQLRSQGLTVKAVRRAVVEAGAGTLATTTSPSIGSMAQVMLSASHNDYAEALYRLAALRRGYPATWSGAKANALDVLRRYGVHVTGLSFYDGSGLSRSDRMTVTTALYLLKRMRLQADVDTVVFAAPGMPTAGVSGTLRTRFTTSPTICAKGVVRAKTGSLDDVVTLSGIAPGEDGRERLFSLLVNYNTATTSARAAVDALAATATGCY